MTAAAPLAVADRAALDRLMPLHMQVSDAGTILHAGPTLTRICAGSPPVGQQLLTLFEVLRPAGAASVAALAPVAAPALKLRLRAAPEIAFRAVAAEGGAAGGLIINLSFGISLVEAVRRFALTNDDFAATDLAIELLYLVEAKSAAFDESRSLNARLQQAQAAAEAQALSDVLTGLKNRRAMDRVLARWLEAGEAFGLMHVDLDFFKEVNDRLGHAAGDHVLQAVARVLLQETRATDIVARVGGDEFVVLLRGLVDSARLEQIAGRIIAGLGRPIAFRGQDCRVSASIGTTVSTLYDRPDADAMLRDADSALYLSKREGRSRATLVSAGALGAGVLASVLGTPGEAPR